MKPYIKILPEKKLIGTQIKMSLANDKTFELWKSFMPRRNEIKNNITADLFSIRVYHNSSYYNNFNPETTFEKWAAIEVTDFDTIPDEMEPYTLTSGLYASFLYKGSSTDTKIYQYIYQTWLPGSNYILDNRPHFEIMGEKYKNNDPTSEEEIWIPIKIR